VIVPVLTTFSAEAASISRPLPGTFSRRWASTPATLEAEWPAAADNELLKGALMTFLSGQPGLHGGHNPDGSYYDDPVHWINYFNGGDAVHGFVRGCYGWPQSLGCVELPVSTAEVANSHLVVADPVTVADGCDCVYILGTGRSRQEE
jgi:hypothetical protein